MSRIARKEGLRSAVFPPGGDRDVAPGAGWRSRPVKAVFFQTPMTSPTLSAAELLVGFDLGLFARADVARWVDEQVERLETLPEALLELTTMRHRHDVDVLRWLGELASVDDVTRARGIGAPKQSHVRAGVS